MTNIINNFLTIFNNDTKYTLVFIDDYIGTVGNPAATTAIFSNGSITGFTIHLDANILKSSAQELQAEVIYHEILHAYLGAYNDSHGGTGDHITMLDSYLTDLVNSVREIYPSMPLKDAYANALYGLSNILNLDDNEESAAFNAALAAQNLTMNDMSAIYTNYVTGNSGSKCSN